MSVCFEEALPVPTNECEWVTKQLIDLNETKYVAVTMFKCHKTRKKYSTHGVSLDTVKI